MVNYEVEKHQQTTFSKLLNLTVVTSRLLSVVAGDNREVKPVAGPDPR